MPASYKTSSTITHVHRLGVLRKYFLITPYMYEELATAKVVCSLPQQGQNGTYSKNGAGAVACGQLVSVQYASPTFILPLCAGTHAI